MTRNEQWVRCPQCGHKLFRLVRNQGYATEIEIKCHSCKAIIPILMGDPKLDISGHESDSEYILSSEGQN